AVQPRLGTSQIGEIREVGISRGLRCSERLGKSRFSLREHLGRSELLAHVDGRGTERFTQEGKSEACVVRRTSDQLLAVGYLLVGPAFQAHRCIVTREASNVQGRVQTIRALT